MSVAIPCPLPSSVRYQIYGTRLQPPCIEVQPVFGRRPSCLDDRGSPTAPRNVYTEGGKASPSGGCGAELLDLEVVSALRRLCAAGTLTAERAEAAVIDLRDLRVQRVSHRPLLARCWELRKNVTVYDAAYIALAESLDASLLTADRRLLDAPGAQCGFELAT